MTDLYENLAAEWMERFAAIDDREHVLPDPSVIWLKARVLQSAKEVERASRPITVAQIGAYGFIAACWTVLLMWKWSALQAWLTTFEPRHILVGSAATQQAPLSMPLLVMFLTLAGVTVMLAMHTILAEE